MTPIRTTQLLIRFAAQASPWWLALLVPGVCLAGWLLARKERRAIARLPGHALTACRLLLLAVLALLAFRPSLVLREQLTFPGRILLLLDNSESMTARDTAMPEAEALSMFRHLRGPVENAEQPFFDRAGELVAAVHRLRRFESVSREADRRRDAFWLAAENAQRRLAETIETVSEPEMEHVGIPPALATRHNALTVSLADLLTRAGTLFTGDRHPGPAAFNRICDSLETVATQFLSLQDQMDAQAGGEAAEQLAAAVRAIRDTRRLDLVTEALAPLREAIPERLSQQGFQILPLMGGEPVALDAFESGDLPPRYGETDIAGRLDALINAENEFPLTAVILASDGRDLSGIPAAVPIQSASRRQVPIFTAGAGAEPEPADIAVWSVAAPPYAVAGRTVRVRATVKVAGLPDIESITVNLLHDGRTVTQAELPVPESGIVQATLAFTPEEPGTGRYTLAVPSDDREIFPLRNNTKAFVMTVREEPVRVLLADWKPGWATRFALNILQRLDYVDLNSIIILTSEEGELARGVGKGTWPRDADMLGIYDLIVLGALPEDGLTVDEWDAIDRFVRDDGKALFLLGAEAAAAVPERLRAGLLPAVAETGHADLSTLALTDPGTAHPLTHALVPMRLPVKPTAALAPALDPEAHPLLVAGDPPIPVLTARYSGAGRVTLLGHDELWRQLNPTALDAHTAVFLNAVSWALAPNAPLRLDGVMLTTRQPLRVWLPGMADGLPVELLQGDEPIAQATATPLHDGATVPTAAFHDLPDGLLTIRAGDLTAPDAVHVVERYRELDAFSRDTDFLRALANDTGALYGPLTDMSHFLTRIEPQARVERDERIFRIWDSGWILALLVAWLSIEWIWRKLAGLV